MRRAAAILVLALVGCRGDVLYDAATFPIETQSIFDDGIRLLFTPDPDPTYECAGARVSWVGNTVTVSFVRAPVGQEVSVSHPVQETHIGHPYVFISNAHLAAGTRARLLVAGGGSERELGSIDGPPSHPAQTGQASSGR